MPHKSSPRHRGLGDALGAGEDDLIPLDEESLFPGLGQIGLFELRRHLAGRRVSALLLRHLVLVRNSFDGHLQELRSGAAKKLRSAREMHQWWRRKNKELVNSKNPTLSLIKLLDEGMWVETWRKKRKR
jgi:hypothetical protein